VSRRFYRRRLIDDELLVVILHRHWREIALPILYTVLLAAPLVLVLLTSLGTSWGPTLLFVIAILAVAAWCWLALPTLVHWHLKSYGVTTRRVLFRDGLRSETQVNLLEVPNPSVQKSTADVMFGSGTIVLDDAHRLLLDRIGHVVKHTKLISQLAANQAKATIELTALLRAMGYTKLTPR
jgi:hypothetical protein